MNLTYEEILSNMKSAYYDECGELADSSSEMGKRLEVVAAELYSLSCDIDYVFRQAFVQTAVGKALDYHGQARNCTRKHASQASGNLTFYINEPLEEELVIAKGTVCSVYQKPYLQYATCEQAVIEAGETSVRVTAQSIGKSEEYNVGRDMITVMVNAPIGVLGVTNDAFSGGCNDESEASFRQRIINHYRIPPNGVNAQSVANVVINLENIIDCTVGYKDSTNEMKIIVSTKSGALSSEDVSAITRTTAVADIFGVKRSISLAGIKYFDIVADVNVRSGFKADEVKQQVEQRLDDVCSVSKIGQNISLSRITKELFDIEGLSDVNIYSPSALGEIIYCTSDAYLKPMEVTVNCFGD